LHRELHLKEEIFSHLAADQSAYSCWLTPTLQGVLVMGVIVVIRTFLSMVLQVELEGHWSWQRSGEGRPQRSV